LKIALGIFVLIVAGTLAILLGTSSHTALKITPKVEFIGTSTPVSVRLENSHGIRHFLASVEQNGVSYPMFESREPAHRFFFWHKMRGPWLVELTAGKDRAPALREGDARLVVEVQSNDFRGATDRIAADVKVITQRPRLTTDGAQHYINQGGAELVTFTVSGYWTEAGVKAGPYKARSFPLPGKPQDQRFSLFPYPWDLPAGTVPVVFASNPANPEVTATFWTKVFPKKFRSRDLVLDDAFLNKVTNEIDPDGKGDLLTRFLRINGEMRRQNNKALSDLRFKTQERFLWSGPFLRLLGTSESNFADVRTYIYQGRKVDRQVHLGFDLAGLSHMPVVAANDGQVIYAAPLGIYGNCVVVDHGYGLQTIYGHMSQIDVKPGDMVKKGQSMGKSGSTGLAGGDHVHFSMQVDGVQVNPIEWWDAHWIHDRILSKIGQ
jgi:murein DD-endopeptidase MepM/ murein hydrolase activator NlpD